MLIEVVKASKIKMRQPYFGYLIFYTIVKEVISMLKIGKPLWSPYIDKGEFIKRILNDDSLSNKEKIMLIIFVLQMKNCKLF